MDWGLLKVVLAIKRSGSLTRAAQQLGTDQTTVGRRLTALEDQIGAPLFIRSKTGFVPTEEGLIAVEHARNIEQQIEAMGDVLSEARGRPAGVVRLMGNNWMLERLALRLFPDVINANPSLELRLSGRLPPVPLHGEATISLWFDAVAHPSDVSIPLFSIPYAAFQSRKTASHPNSWVQFLDDDATGPSFSRQVRKRIPTGTTVRMTATDAAILRTAIVAGIGNGIIPLCLGEEDEALELVPGGTRVERVLHVHLNPGTARTRRVQNILAALMRSGPEIFGARLLAKRHDLLPVSLD